MHTGIDVVATPCFRDRGAGNATYVGPSAARLTLHVFTATM